MKTVTWFSAGASSAVATWLALKEYPDLDIMYIHIDDQHEDTMRFLHDCEEWYGRKITVMQSKYKNVNNVLRAFRYVNGPGGARCTVTLKKRVRKEWESTQTDKIRYVWGFDANERNRADRLFESMPEQEHVFPLIDKQLNKQQIHGMLHGVGIKRPAMYDLGFSNNNCIMCVKGGMGYQNKCRKLWPEIFAERAKIEREVGYSCIKGVFLDDLDPDAGRMEKEIMPDCGLFCDINSI